MKVIIYFFIFVLVLLTADSRLFAERILGEKADELIEELKEDQFFQNNSYYIFEKNEKSEEFLARPSIFINPYGGSIYSTLKTNKRFVVRLSKSHDKSFSRLTDESLESFKNIIEKHRLQTHIIKNRKGNLSALFYLDRKLGYEYQIRGDLISLYIFRKNMKEREKSKFVNPYPKYQADYRPKNFAK